MPRLAVLLVLLVAAPAVSAASTSAPADPCGQYGVFVQLGLDNQYTCAGPCKNEGVTAVVGLTGDYDCAGCTQGGVFVFTGGSACGGRFVLVCAGSECVGPNAAAAECGAVTDPVCWSLEFGNRAYCTAFTALRGYRVC